MSTVKAQLAGLFLVGDWRADPSSGELSRGGETVRLEARTMRLLAYFAARAGEVVSVEEMLEQVWPNVMVTQDSAYQAIASLRRALGDDSKQPRYIATVPRFGYRLVAKVDLVDTAGAACESVERHTARPQDDEPAAAPVVEMPRVTVATSTESAPRRSRRRAWLAATVVVSGAIGVVLWRSVAVPASIPAVPLHAVAAAPASPSVATPARSVAVLPFRDLTDSMTEEPFADGMSEELIDQLSKLPGIAVAPPTSSFYYKDKQVTVAEVSNALHTAFVLDGSVRKAGNTLRVAARLTRARDGFVVWSDTYDRTWQDKLMIQDDIAQSVAKALSDTIR